MTPKQRAAYLLKECGTPSRAVSHVNWVIDGAKKDATREHWQSVLKLLLPVE